MITQATIVEQLLGEAPAARPVVEEHLADNDGELLLHLLMSDLERMVVNSHVQGDMALTDRLLSITS